MKHSAIPQMHRCDGRLAGGAALLALAAGCLLVPSRSLLWWVAIPLAAGAGALLPSTSPRSRWVAAGGSGLALWIAYVLIRTPMTQLDVSLCFLALAVVWVSWRLAGLRSTEGAGLILGSLALLSLGGAAARIYAGSSASLSHMEVWRPEDQGLVTPLLWPELAVGLSILALPLLLAEARSAPYRAARIAAKALCLPLVAGMAFVAGGLGWLCAALGILWACVRGRWLRWPIWVGVAVVAVGVGAYALHKLPDRDDAVRNRAVVSLQTIVDARTYAWSSALCSLGAEPLGILLDPSGLGHGWPTDRPVSWVALSGIERTRSPLSDAVLLTAELGWVAPAFLVLAGVALVRGRGSRATAGLAGALVGGGSYALLVGHLASPVNAALLLAIALRLLDSPSARALRVTCPALGHYLAAAGVAAVLVACTLAPTNEESSEDTQAHRLATGALAVGTQQAYEDAARAYLIRWEALHSAPWSHPRERVRSTARDYAAFCAHYASFLDREDDADAARAYRVLADQLEAEASR